ncbi:DMT family transporter [Streptomyces sp. NPDC091267]|uniref:DMT family transporter n=1 Tax=Streptomyces sp. NPDC091267 TaxID=3155195 RepID=UPI003439C7AD
MSSLALSVLLSLVSAVAYAAGAIVQERVATASDGRSLAPLRDRVWWAAVALNGVGAVLHVVALAYGPLSLVQPLGALTIVFALPMSALFVRRRAGATAWRGAIMATVGLAGLLALTGSSDAHTLGGPQQLMLAIVTFGAVAALILISKAMHRPVVRSVVLAGGAGVAFGIASVFTKTVAMEWTAGSVGTGLPTLLVIAALAATGLLMSQAAYRGAGLTAPLATVTVVNPVVAAAVGITLFGEQFRHGTTGALLALACGALAAGGLILLTTERLGAEGRRQGQRVAAGGEERQTADGEGESAGAEDRVTVTGAARTADEATATEDEVAGAADEVTADEAAGAEEEVAGASVTSATASPTPPGATAKSPVQPVTTASRTAPVPGADTRDFGRPAGSPDPAGALRQQLRPTSAVAAIPGPVGPKPSATAAETVPAPLPLPVLMPLERRVGQRRFGPDRPPHTGAVRRGGSSAGSTASAAATAVPADDAGPDGNVQTLTPPALR